jgi:cellulose synthase/poly-beta-1,6-N-acetylglucosamine synthase-like glycosyltransferase
MKFSLLTCCSADVIYLLTNQPVFVFFGSVLFAIALGLLFPIAVLFIESSAALFPDRDMSWLKSVDRPRIAVLVPAHNEASGIEATIKTILPELTAQDRLVVIAHNCTDDTAEIAKRCCEEYIQKRRCNSEVPVLPNSGKAQESAPSEPPFGILILERNDPEPTRWGKGYALDYGLRAIEGDPPDVVVMIDADCIVEEGTIKRIASVAASSSRPVQATYLMKPPAEPKLTQKVSALAFMVKNLVRPKGLARLGLPCLLTGSGMAFPWSAIASAPLATGNIVEDMQLGIDLAIAGYPPLFCQDAEVSAFFSKKPKEDGGAWRRWVLGHLITLRTQSPRLIKAAVQQKRFDLLALALELCVPPLSLLVMIWVIVMGGTLVAGTLGTSWIPAIVLAIEGFLLFISVITAWAKFGRSYLSLWTLLTVPFFILQKIPIFLGMLIRRLSDRTSDRRDDNEKSSSLS